MPASDTIDLTQKSSKRKRRIFRWKVRLGVLVLGVGYLVVFGCDSRFYYPTHEVYYTPDQLGYDYEPVRFPTNDGLVLSGWFLPSDQPSRGTVIHFHGNAQNITSHFLGTLWLLSEGYNVFVFDYRGYGESEGRPTREGTILDGHAAIDYVKTRPEYDPDRLFVYGQSLGGAIGTYVSAERPEVKAVVAESTFGDYREIAAMHLNKRFLPKFLAKGVAMSIISDGYDPVDVVEKVSPRPILVIVGGADTICYPELGRQLYDAAAEPKAFLVVDDARHLEVTESGYGGAKNKIIETFEKGAAQPSR